MNEQALARGLTERKERGRYFTAAPLAQFVLEQVAPLVPKGPCAIVDPACGAGSFLAAAASRWPSATLLGLELSAAAARQCRDRVPKATVLEGDALKGGLTPLLARVPSNAFELWVGNPPYNGTSPVLRDARTYEALQRLLPATLPKGTSLRDDYAFFLLLARQRLQGRRGALAFITSASLLDAFIYGPLRRALLESFELRQVVELGPGAFEDTQVRTCVTIWATERARSGPSFSHRERFGPFEPGQLTAPRPFAPAPPEWLFRPPTSEALSLDAAWRERGELLSTLIPVTFPGLKTRFDELLVDADPTRLHERVSSFLRCQPRALARFSREWNIPERCLPKLTALHQAAIKRGVEADPAFVRPFFRYAGARHRGQIPKSAEAFCYLDRRLIPRGDHRLRGPYDPHVCAFKLVFNARELPLSAAVVERPGCVHDHRHARFAPLWVPRHVWESGLAAATRGPLGPDVVNLSERGRAWAKSVGGPQKAFRALSDFINSSAVQEVWAPAFGTSRDLPIPLEGPFA